MNGSHEQVFDSRSHNVKGVIVGIDDTGQAQTVDVQTHDGIVRSGIEVMQFFGFASRAPVLGGTVLLMAIGGDVGHYEALPLANPSIRYGNMVEGDGGVLYGPDGSRVAVMNGGVVQIVGMTQVEVLTDAVTITAPSGVTIDGATAITGNLSITGDVSATGSMTIGGDLVVAGNITGHHVTSLT